MLRFLSRLSFLIFLITVLAGCDDAADRETGYLDRGKELFESGDTVKASIEFRNVLQINPKSVEARYYLARIDEENGNFPNAFERYRRALEQDPDFIPAHSRLGRLYVMANDLPQAQSHADAILALEPENPEGRLIKSSIFMRRGEIDKAAAESKAVLELDPDNSAAAIILAGAYAEEGRDAEAMATIEDALAKNPKHENLIRMKVTQHLGKNEFNRAEEAYKSLVAAASDQVSVRAELAWFYISQDRIDDAEAVLRSSVAELPEVDQAKRMLVDFLLNYRGVDAAANELNSYIERFPGKHSYRFGLASIYAENDRKDDAAEIYRHIIEQDGTGPSGLLARSSLARQMFADGDRAEAAALVEEVLKRDPLNGPALLLRGQIRYASEKYDDAIADLRSVLRDDPNSESALRMLAEAHMREGQTELAKDALRNLIHLNPNDADAMARLATLHLRSNDLSHARSLVKDAMTISPDSDSVLEAAVAVRLAEGDVDWAIEKARALAANRDSELQGRLLLGRILRAQERYDAAVDQYGKALEIDENSVPALKGTIENLMFAQRLDEAEKILQGRIDRGLADSEAYTLLGRVYDKAGRDMEMVEPMFRRASELSPASVSPVLDLGRAYIARHRYADAISIIQAGLERSPAHELLSLDLAYAYEKVGDVKNAIAIYEQMVDRGQGGDIAKNNFAALVADFEYEDTDRLEKAHRITSQFRDSAHPILLDTLGWVNYRLGNFGQAETLLRKAIEQGLTVPPVYYHLGMVYVALGQKEKAREALAQAMKTDEEYTGIETARRALGAI